MSDRQRCLGLLRAWARAAERYWYPIPGRPELGCYGSGYDAWGVQTNQKYLSAMATVAAEDGDEWCLERALAALRFSCSSHLTGDGRCTDGRQWGHTWISALGIERMMHALPLLTPHMTEVEHAALRTLLISEADWLAHDMVRGGVAGVVGDKWGASGKNNPESNIWNGAILWRVAAMYPDHTDVELWREEAHRLLMNGVSIDADAQDDRVVAGGAVREWFAGANFFDHYALDHHAYFNVGYMMICVSNAAMLHFDMKAQGFDAPESLYHHQADLWQVLRRMLFSNGRLARLGGDSRVRYSYCQEYLLPSVLMAADVLEESCAGVLINGQLDIVERDARAAGDGSFYAGRLTEFVDGNHHYLARLESDRACCLSMLLAYAPQVDAARLENRGAEAFEKSVAGGWEEPEYGAVLHRGPARLASFAWRAHGLSQGLCLPPERGHMAEWPQNLAGAIRFMGDEGAYPGSNPGRRTLEEGTVRSFDGGFVASGRVAEGVGIAIPEGWTSEAQADHRLAVVALPDGHTMIGLQFCRILDARAYTTRVSGLNLGVPNDCFNDTALRLRSAGGEQLLKAPAAQDEVLATGLPWLCFDDCLGVAGIYGAEELVIRRGARRGGGKYHSLYVEECCWAHAETLQARDPGEVILDVGWAVLASAGAAETERFEAGCDRLDLAGSLRGVRMGGLDGLAYAVVANFGDEAVELERGTLGTEGESVRLAPGVADVIKL